MPIRITNRTDGYAYWSDIARGLTWAADNGADVANISYGVSNSSTVSSAAQYMRNKMVLWLLLLVMMVLTQVTVTTPT